MYSEYYTDSTHNELTNILTIIFKNLFNTIILKHDYKVKFIDFILLT